jgi:lipopolysaccharide/colanic/teichoic acid biosynthesis glycosyltransferase
VAGVRVFAPKHPGYLPVKFTVEWLIALGLVLATSPLVLLLAILVKVTSRGPAFYAQTRLGKNGRLYKLYKLRTMVHNAEAKTGPVWAAKNDLRTTSLGRILRKMHMDEFPQLFNVLLGQMSLIGPRPERPEIAVRLEPEIQDYRLRLLARPGITGLAQMLVPADDPNDPTMRGVRLKVAHDIYYVRELSFLLDLRIALSTPCYFICEAADSIRESMVRRYGEAVESEHESSAPPDDHRLHATGNGNRRELRLTAQSELFSDATGA